MADFIEMNHADMLRQIAELDKTLAGLEKSVSGEINLSKLKIGKVSAVRFSTLNAICKVLHCQPGDILEYAEDED